MADNGSNVQPQTAAGAEINSEWITLYDRSGAESRWRHEDLAKAEAAGLSLTKYNLDEAFSDWKANHRARASAIEQAVGEVRDAGCIRDEVFDVLNQAVGAEIDAYRNLLASIGATVPHESHLAALAEHKKIHGSLAGLPFEQQHEGAADALPADRVAYWKRHRTADDTAAAKAVRAGLEAGTVVMPDASMYDGDEGLAAAHRARIIEQARAAGYQGGE